MWRTCGPLSAILIRYALQAALAAPRDFQSQLNATALTRWLFRRLRRPHGLGEFTGVGGGRRDEVDRLRRLRRDRERRRRPTNRRASGVLKERAQSLVRRFVPQSDKARNLQAMADGMLLLAKLGITSMQNASGDRETIALFEGFAQAGQLTARTAIAPSVEPLAGPSAPWASLIWPITQVPKSSAIAPVPTTSPASAPPSARSKAASPTGANSAIPSKPNDPNDSTFYSDATSG